MTERETTRLVAWSHELRQVHVRLRKALELTRTAVAEGRSADAATRDLMLFCHGFCAALDGHHRGEDDLLFPAIKAAHPQLAPVLRNLTQDHSMIAHLLGGLRAAVDRAAPVTEVDRHLEGVAAIMESHFRYEERQLLSVLETLSLDVPPEEVLGPL
ncbi:hemerythrin domain-containing protein [Actinoplanes awajinensis]|uniref:Cation-binding protein n=1 Tax=Actinoplanes awajinensis subsp. mycoplanecinus TaxID=135947 RepID=A0A101JEH1_9ACTN|nr:hemerythrin domain-containing protein [Actinoplanes awajinensis]KUL25323.1 cation-binding protein [Actinoplanes awajinensis subsp. mycoplanecinus]